MASGRPKNLASELALSPPPPHPNQTIPWNKGNCIPGWTCIVDLCPDLHPWLACPGLESQPQNAQEAQAFLFGQGQFLYEQLPLFSCEPSTTNANSMGKY